MEWKGILDTRLSIPQRLLLAACGVFMIVERLEVILDRESAWSWVGLVAAVFLLCLAMADLQLPSFRKAQTEKPTQPKASRNPTVILSVLLLAVSLFAAYFFYEAGQSRYWLNSARAELRSVGEKLEKCLAKQAPTSFPDKSRNFDWLPDQPKK